MLNKSLKNKKEKKDSEILRICQKCRSFKYDGSWHFEEPIFMKDKSRDEKIYVKFSICPTCRLEELFLEQHGEFAQS